jgi:hypothetical protein
MGPLSCTHTTTIATASFDFVEADHKVTFGLPEAYFISSTILNVDIAATKDEVAGVTIRRDALYFTDIAFPRRRHCRLSCSTTCCRLFLQHHLAYPDGLVDLTAL